VRHLGRGATRASHGKRAAVRSGNTGADIAGGSSNRKHRSAAYGKHWPTTNGQHRTTSHWQFRQCAAGNDEPEQSERQYQPKRNSGITFEPEYRAERFDKSVDAESGI
jgi:hypothetical protein